MQNTQTIKPIKHVTPYGIAWERFADLAASQSASDADRADRYIVESDVSDSLASLPESTSTTEAIELADMIINANHDALMAKNYDARSAQWDIANAATVELRALVEKLSDEEFAATAKPHAMRQGWSGVLDTWDESRFYAAKEWLSVNGGAA